MNLKVRNMDEKLAKQTLGWKYEKPFDFYNGEMSEEGIKERLDDSYKVLIDEKGKVFGFFCTGESARIPIGYQYGVYNEKSIDMGIGMNPVYVGKGYGYDFCSFIMNHIKEQNEGVPIRLSVATFNKRAVHLYKNLGFVMKDKFATDSAEFITMIKAD
ncbi:GNAT family N-acetyltransferase [Aquibacillus sp. 3ASR75-11]|uniref:GNAT family N-acetyltransferase n=1 Tax=Terrihalobacillus insolitus TaxID=2950438 RepID=A0A9X4ALA9_9BACI|nr:GNAT family N-acetyltransferase [Terrihalobacillus insolitus]MDC3414710.1 GNAT family N-acetyltransferase [Terrihalobacillus insolitus]MDC3424177.1 GNAT family N-acetyltransferase [Terrihalobacillus insolitus]